MTMSTVQQWGRKEAIIWPPHGYVYTLGAFLFACMLTGVFVYIHFQYGLLSLQCYYLPYYLRSETAGLTHPVSAYQLLYLSDGEKPSRPALESDVAPGSTAPIRRPPIASNPYSPGGSAWHFCPLARGTPQLPKQGTPCVDWALDLRRRAGIQAFHAAIHLWH